jgi:hypothetical protein
MKRYILACMTVAVVFGCSLASVRADDINQPPWPRYTPQTTFQDWTFDSSTRAGFVAASWYNLSGTPTATITGGSWLDHLDQRSGVWALPSGTSSIDLTIPDNPPSGSLKDVWAQITWESTDGGVPVVTVDGTVAAPEIVALSRESGSGNWMQYTYQTAGFTGTGIDTVDITTTTGTINVGEIVIDTIPEPSSLALLAVGAIGLYASRKRSLAA